MSCRAPATHTVVASVAPAADAMNKGVAAPAHKAATLPKARILLAPNTLTSCFEPPQGNAAERTLTYEEPRRSPPPRIWAFSRPSFVPHTEPHAPQGPAPRQHKELRTKREGQRTNRCPSLNCCARRATAGSMRALSR